MNETHKKIFSLEDIGVNSIKKNNPPGSLLQELLINITVITFIFYFQIMSTRTTTTHACPTTTTPTYLTPSPPSIMHTHLATTVGMSNFSTSNVNDNRPTTNTIRQHTTLLNTLYTQAESISWRLRQYCIEAITANSRRRRRRRDDINNNNNYSNSNYATNCSGSNCIQTNSNNINNNSFTYSTPLNAALPDADYYDHNNNNSYMCTNNNNNISSRNNRNLSKATTTMLSSPVIQVFNVIAQSLSSSSTAITYITALLVLTTLCSFCAASPCDRNNWWDPLKDKCIPCTVCKDGLIPLRPCQFQCDTICGSIYDLKIDWLVLAKTEPNWKEVSSWGLHRFSTSLDVERFKTELCN